MLGKKQQEVAVILDKELLHLQTNDTRVEWFKIESNVKPISKKLSQEGVSHVLYASLSRVKPNEPTIRGVQPPWQHVLEAKEQFFSIDQLGTGQKYFTFPVNLEISLFCNP